MTDFDPASESDLNELRSHSWVVYTNLVSAHSPRQEVSTMTSPSESGAGSRTEVMRLLLGTTVSSPFFCADDPDPETAPTHPVSEAQRPPSPTSRFIPVSAQSSRGQSGGSRSSPGTFFVFADLSVRKAGEYRLEFRLMKMEAHNLQPGCSVPTVSSTTSQVFRVVNAKDFDQVQPSTRLVKGLIDRGAGFPLKLKKGIREGQRRRGPTENSDDDEDDEDDDG